MFLERWALQTKGRWLLHLLIYILGVYSVILSAILWIQFLILEKMPKPQPVLTEFHQG